MSSPLDNREQAQRTVTRMRADLARLANYLQILETTETIPDEVKRAIVVLERWTRKLVKAGRPTRPRTATTRAVTTASAEPAQPKPPPVEPGPLAAKPRLRQGNRRTKR